MAEWLEHPLVLLATGAALSQWLIPRFTRQWQDRQKELELKTSLVRELCVAIMEIVMAIQFDFMSARLDPDDRVEARTNLNEAYRVWEVRSAVIGTMLQAYFSRKTIPVRWAEFSEIVTLFYARQGIPEQAIPQADRQLRDRLAGLLESLDSPVVAGDGWDGCRSGILEARARLIQEVLRERIKAVGSSRGRRLAQFTMNIRRKRR